MKYWRVIALAFLAINAALIGVWAQFAPDSFYRSFPGAGRRWISIDGPYNEHLIRDVGGLNLALAALTIAALVWKGAQLIRITGIAWAVYAIPHVIYHAAHLDDLDSTADKMGSIGGLALMALLPVLLAVAPEETRRVR